MFGFLYNTASKQTATPIQSSECKEWSQYPTCKDHVWLLLPIQTSHPTHPGLSLSTLIPPDSCSISSVVVYMHLSGFSLPFLRLPSSSRCCECFDQQYFPRCCPSDIQPVSTDNHWESFHYRIDAILKACVQSIPNTSRLKSQGGIVHSVEYNKPNCSAIHRSASPKHPPTDFGRLDDFPSLSRDNYQLKCFISRE